VSTLEVSEFRTLLEQERLRLAAAVEFLQDKSSGSLDDELGEIGGGGSDNHLGDTAGAAYDRELDHGLEEGAQQTLEEIDAAIARIDDGTYGTCENCGTQIPQDRLRAIPWARLCIDDQRRTG
jgi:RNA polymerase-binding transcription factor DksA